MTILIAPDKFKGSRTARQVCEAIEEGLRKIDPSLEIISIPFADGGEGTGDLLTEFSSGSKINVTVSDPIFRPITSGYGLSGDGSTAFIEMAKASGLQLLSGAERNPLKTSTVGTGELIVDALNRNVKKIVLGIGGSATNDAGMGMATAFGYRFLSSENEELKPTGENLIRVHSIDSSKLHPRLAKVSVTVIYDVDNPLYGNRGAAHVFAKQKGASPEDIVSLDSGLRNFARVVMEQFSMDINFPGAGAGGGMSAAAAVFLNAQFSPGIEFIMQFTDLESKIKASSLIITGEGKIDEQTLSGKVVSGVARLAAKHKKPCIAFTGKCDLGDDGIKVLGLARIISLTDEETNEQDAMGDAFQLLRKRTIEFLPSWISQH